MIRLVAMSCAGAVVFVGFSIPFLLPGGTGIIVGTLVVVAGLIALWLAESKTKNLLHTNTKWNRTMKADGENFIERDEID